MKWIIFNKKNIYLTYLNIIIGGAVAINLATEPENSQRIWCLILENTFTSIPDMAALLFGLKCLQYLPLFLYKNKVNFF